KPGADELGRTMARAADLLDDDQPRRASRRGDRSASRSVSGADQRTVTTVNIPISSIQAPPSTTPRRGTTKTPGTAPFTRKENVAVPPGGTMSSCWIAGRPRVVLLGREDRVCHAVELELDPDRMPVVPGVARMPGGIAFSDDLSDMTIAANDVMRAHVRRQIAEGPQRARVADIGVMDD